MGKKSQLDVAIEKLESERRVLDLAIEKLRAAQQAQTPKRKRTPKPLDIARPA